MDGLKKLAGLKEFMAVEPAEETPQMKPAHAANDVSGLNQIPDAGQLSNMDECPFEKDALPIQNAVLPGGKSTRLLKTVLTSACERNCNYCAFRAGRDFRRYSFQPDELAATFMNLFRHHQVDGLFLSSGVAGGGVHTQDRLLAAAEILREKYQFKGYLHLKVMPGAEFAQVERAMQLADRVSVNLEAPTTDRLKQLAPQKVLLEELLSPLRWVEEIRAHQPYQKGWNMRWPSSTTQFVVGAGGETDAELLRAAHYLHKTLKLSRIYYSGFKPVQGTPLENQTAVNPLRQQRLYQADFLLRDYGFLMEELSFDPLGGLPLDVDPKIAWAQSNLAYHPVEINLADYRELLRVPGIGRHSAHAIIAARRKNRLRCIEDLQALGIAANRAAPFILLDGRQPNYQLRLW